VITLSPTRWSLVLVLGLAALFSPARAAGLLRIEHPRCEYTSNPLGIDVAQPRLSWELASEARGQRQTAYQILVASTAQLLAQDRGDLWDSGKVASDETAHIAYAGTPLKSSQQVFWKLRSWDVAGEVSGWSDVSTWTMGVLRPEDWLGKWIAAPWTSEAVILRREFDVAPGVKRAVLHLSGLGQYEFFLNGPKGTENLLTPGWTNFDRTTLYDTYDVTSQLRPGRNALGVALGNGMYHVVRRNRFAKFTGSFGPLRLLAQLEIEYADGRREVVPTDDSWRVHRGAITYNSIYGGEDYDARLEPSGWKVPGFADSSWESAVYIVRPNFTLKGFTRAAPPIRAIETRSPVAVRELRPGVVLYDFGQNASFMPRVRVAGPRGSTVRMTPGEVVKADGTIERGTMGGAHRGSAWWQYTKGTDGEESWFPQFYYVGSRYLYVELLPEKDGAARPNVLSLESVIVHSVADPDGEFATSNPLLNRIRDLVRWAQRSNMVSVLTDCPHREKLGWIEQYHLNGPSIRYEYDVAKIYAKLMADMAEAQTGDGLVPNIAPEYTEFKGAFRSAAEWGAAFIQVPWQQYQFSGDTQLVREHYAAMKRYFAYLESRAKDDVLNEGLGDWYDFIVEKNGRAGLTPPEITATAFYFQDAATLAQIAQVLGQADDAKRFSATAERIARKFNEKFAHPERASYGTDSQCSLALPLALNLAPPEQRASVLDTLAKDVDQRGYATAGDIGFRSLLLALAEGGRSDVIYRMINQDEKPGYGYQLKQGATALAESWNASLGASHNHFMLGQVTEWFYGYVAGIRPDATAPGFKRVIIAPQPVGDLKWVEASYSSIRGPIRVRWDRVGPRLSVRVHIPANTTATVILPTRSAVQVSEGGRAVATAADLRVVSRNAEPVTIEVPSGDYVFECQL
jgi:alpha-L-rhamnosidase